MFPTIAYSQEELSREGAQSTVSNAFLYAVYSMEISRLKFLLNAYLRTRLVKIEQHYAFMLTQDDLLQCMSKQEIAFAKR